MALTTTIKVKGREYSLSLHEKDARCNSDDENFAEWVVFTDDKRVLEVTVWKDGLGRFTSDGIVEVYKNKTDYNNGLLLDKKKIKVKKV